MLNKYMRQDLIDRWNRTSGKWLEEVNKEYEERKRKDLIDKFHRALEEKEFEEAARIANTIFKMEGIK